MKQKAKKVSAATVTAYLHLAGVKNVLRLLETAGWRTEFFAPESSAEQGWERQI